MDRIRVVLAEDHHVVRAAIAAFLAKEADIEVVGEVADATRLLDIVGILQPHVLLLDAHMPGHRIIDSARTIKAQYPRLKILILSAYNRSEYVVGLLSAGAAGYVLKDDPPETLLRAVRAVVRGERWLSPRVTEVLVRSANADEDYMPVTLTPREREVLHLMANGQRNELIAETLTVTEQTVKNHVRNIFSKLGVTTRVEAVLYAVQHGLNQGDP